MNIRQAQPQDLDPLIALEQASYPADEAASRSAFETRLRLAPQCFTVGLDHQDLVALVCGTRSAETSLVHESMTSHDSAGQSLCIHSVAVAADRRRQGLALCMLRDYLARAGKLPGLVQVLLICKPPLTGLYEQAGFKLVGPSAVVHGHDPWLEMCHRLG